MADPSPCPCSDLNPTPEDHPLGRLRQTHDHLSRLATSQQRTKCKSRGYCNLILPFRTGRPLWLSMLPSDLLEDDGKTILTA